MSDAVDSTMFAFAPRRVWAGLFSEHPVDPEFAARRKRTLAASAMTAPLRALERVVCRRRVAAHQMHPSPVYILGYGRSGTTHLHNLMTRDPQFGYVDLFQTIAPEFTVVGRFLRPLLARTLPATRPMDNVAVSIDAPQEEELAMAASSRHSYLHYLTFPRTARHFADRYVTMSGLSDRDLEQWRRDYLRVVRKASYLADGRRLVLKSPVNTGRVPELRRVFPEARFIFIYRNPYVVFRSIDNLFRKLLPSQTMQEVDWQQIEDDFVALYRGMTKKYLRDAESIPSGSLVEVRFEDLEADPLAELRRIYDALGLPGFDAARPVIEGYLDTLSGYRKNTYDIDPRTIARVNAEWGFAVDRFGYDRLSVPTLAERA